MREIKFRAWDREESKMFEVMEMKWYRRCFSVPGCILMQYTGLKDKNGKEIYEGDIVKTDVYVEGVIFTDGSYFTKGRGQHFLTNDPPYYEIIGNIYENPELLK